MQLACVSDKGCDVPREGQHWRMAHHFGSCRNGLQEQSVCHARRCLDLLGSGNAGLHGITGLVHQAACRCAKERKSFVVTLGLHALLQRNKLLQGQEAFPRGWQIVHCHVCQAGCSSAYSCHSEEGEGEGHLLEWSYCCGLWAHCEGAIFHADVINSQWSEPMDCLHNVVVEEVESIHGQPLLREKRLGEFDKMPRHRHRQEASIGDDYLLRATAPCLSAWLQPVQLPRHEHPRRMAPGLFPRRRQGCRQRGPAEQFQSHRFCDCDQGEWGQLAIVRFYEH
mmetsp:Transcript_28420/g.65929  ORF Transcript_28420/g.65929 Transcript_28420/m.65929 type:complete len:281 (+) Transcript_28420:1005-1847(+)